MNIKIHIVGLLFFLNISSCVKFDLYKTAHPEQACLFLATEWNKRTDGLSIPSSCRVMLNQQQIDFKYSVEEQALPLQLEGDYSLLVYNEAANITVNQMVATVDIANGYVNPFPGYLFSYAQKVKLLNDNDLHVVAPMRQQTHALILTLLAEPRDIEVIESISATLDGIAFQMNLLEGMLVADARSTSFDFIEINGDLRADNSRASNRADIRLLGVVSTSMQKLKLLVKFKNGQSTTVENDMSVQFKDFNENKHVPLALETKLKLNRTESGFTATIEDWKSDQRDIIAD